MVSEKKQERSNEYKGKKFKGFYQGYEDPEFIISIGHSPSHSNAKTKDGITEYYFNKELAEKLIPEFEAQGIKWGILEREDKANAIDTKFVNENFKDVKLIELHNNAYKNSNANGVEALEGDQEIDNEFGKTMVQEISKDTGLKLRGIEGLRKIVDGNGKGFMNRLPNLPNSLVEIGFFTNEKDMELIKKNNGYNVMLGIINGYRVSNNKERITELKAYDKNGNLKQDLEKTKKEPDKKRENQQIYTR